MSTPEYKVVILGQPGVGKTSLVNRIAGQGFQDHHQSTIGSPKKKIKLSEEFADSDNNPHFIFFDTSGQRQWNQRSEPSLRKSQDGETHAVIITLDMMKPLEENKVILSVFQELALKEAPSAHLLVVLTKLDLLKHAQTRRDDVASWINNPTVSILETSAKELLNIREFKQALTQTCVASAKAMASRPPEPVAKTYDYSIRDLWNARHNKTLLNELATAVTNPLVSTLKPQESFWKIGLVNAVYRFFLLRTKDFRDAALEKSQVYTALYCPKKGKESVTPRPSKIISSHSRFVQHGIVPVEPEESNIGTQYAEGRKRTLVEEGFVVEKSPQPIYPPVINDTSTISLG